MAYINSKQYKNQYLRSSLKRNPLFVPIIRTLCLFITKTNAHEIAFKASRDPLCMW